jgi:cytochrome c-type biogenesis protein CcmH
MFRFRLLNAPVALFFLLSLLANSAIANTLYPLPSKKQDAQFEHLLKSLRCLVCQNQDLEGSNASLAQDLRLQVYEMVKKGQSDSEVIGYLTARYGDFILFQPPVKALTALLWFGPFLFLAIGFWLVVRFSCKSKSKPKTEVGA